MITVSKTTYQTIEQNLETWLQQSHWNRMYSNGKRLGKDEVIKRFDLKCLENGDKVIVELVSKENPEHKPYSESFYRFMDNAED